VTFTPGNWSTPQNVVLTAADDLVNDGTVEYMITTTLTSTDPLYSAINPDDVRAETIDNEAAFALPSGDLTYGIGEPATGIDGYATVSDLDTADYNGGGLTLRSRPAAAAMTAWMSAIPGRARDRLVFLAAPSATRASPSERRAAEPEPRR